VLVDERRPRNPQHNVLQIPEKIFHKALRILREIHVCQFEKSSMNRQSLKSERHNFLMSNVKARSDPVTAPMKGTESPELSKHIGVHLECFKE
jgi:hypothetical protein